MDIDYDEIHKSAEEFRKAAEALKDFHAKKKLTRSGQLYKSDAKRLEGLERRLAESQATLVVAMPPILAARGLADNREEPQTIDLDQFFAAVGTGFLKAQRNLDAASSEYLKTVSGQPHILPSIFRIPKMSAEVKFAVDKIDQETVGLIFYKEQQKAQTLNQQSVQFEIVSAPPPQGTPVAPVIASVVLSKTRRAEILDAVKAYRLPGDNTGTTTDNRLDRPNLLQDRDTVIIIAIDGDKRFLLAAANLAAAGNVGVWYFDAQPPSLAVLRKFGSPADPNITFVRDFITMLGNTQKAFLNKLA
jgi:hypothetical protein